MPLLYYWRPDNYARDQEFGFGYHLSQNSPAMASALPGDSSWAFTRRRRDGRYILAAELVVRAVTRNRPAYRYGTYRAWCDLERSRYFDVEAGPGRRARHPPAHRLGSRPAPGPVISRARCGARARRGRPPLPRGRRR